MTSDYELLKIKITIDLPWGRDRTKANGYFDENIRPDLKEAFGEVFDYGFLEESPSGFVTFIISVRINSTITEEFIEETAKNIKTNHTGVSNCVTSKM